MDVEDDGLSVGNAEALLNHLANPSDGVRLRGVRQPHGQLVPLAPHVDRGPVDLAGVRVSPLTDEEEENFQPEVVEQL